MTASARRRLVAATVVLGAAAAALQGGTSRAAASCILGATYLQAPYFGVGSLTAADVGGVVGLGTIPACNDTPGSGIVVEPTPVNLLRVSGVAPRFAVGLPGGSGAPASLIVAAGSPCLTSTVTESLVCLRQLTARLLAGPALITYPSARPRDVIQLASTFGTGPCAAGWSTAPRPCSTDATATGGGRSTISRTPWRKGASRRPRCPSGRRS